MPRSNWRFTFLKSMRKFVNLGEKVKKSLCWLTLREDGERKERVVKLKRRNVGSIYPWLLIKSRNGFESYS